MQAEENPPVTIVPQTREKTLAKLKKARYQGDLAILMLDETLALADAHLLK